LCGDGALPRWFPQAANRQLPLSNLGNQRPHLRVWYKNQQHKILQIVSERTPR
jgi:hypothetical protein